MARIARLVLCRRCQRRQFRCSRWNGKSAATAW